MTAANVVTLDGRIVARAITDGREFHGVVSKLSRRAARQPRSGSLPWIRSWYGDDYRRGAACRVEGERARILSASNGRVAVYVWSTGKRRVVLPGAITFDVAELALV